MLKGSIPNPLRLSEIVSVLFFPNSVGAPLTIMAIAALVTVLYSNRKIGQTPSGWAWHITTGVVGGAVLFFGTAEVSKKNELQADKFALNVLVRTIELEKAPLAGSSLELAKQIAYAALDAHPEDEQNPFTTLNVHPSTVARQQALRDYRGSPAPVDH